MVCPLAKLHVRTQFDQAVELVFWMVIAAWNPPGHELVIEYTTWQLVPPPLAACVFALTCDEGAEEPWASTASILS